MGKKEIFGIILSLIAIGVLIFSGYKIIYEEQEYRQAAEKYEELSMQLTQPGKGTILLPDIAEDTVEDCIPAPKTIDFAGLQQKNPDIIGWIAFIDPEIPIDYPIVHSEHNEDYLRRNVWGEYSRPGSIILESTNTPDMQDLYTIIYGHNMRDTSMFSSLSKYKKQTFYEEHSPFFFLYTPEHVYLYQIFACHTVDKNSKLYTTGFEVNDIWESFVKEMMLKTRLYPSDVSIKRNDRIVTLSTCTEEKGRRFAVHAKRVCEVMEK